MTSSNAPAAGGRIESDGRGPERGSNHPPPPPQPQAQPSPQPAATPSKESAPAQSVPNAANATIDTPLQPSSEPTNTDTAPPDASAPAESTAPKKPDSSHGDPPGATGPPTGDPASEQIVQSSGDEPASRQDQFSMLDPAHGALDRANDGETELNYYDHPMMSPPTVSPLSTPAVTHVNLDDEKDVETLVLSGPADQVDFATTKKSLQEPAVIVPSAATAALTALSKTLNAGPASSAMDIDEPQLPDMSQYHVQLMRQHALNPAGNGRSNGVGARNMEHMQSIATTDPEPDNMQRYDSGRSNANGNVDPNVLMMALANASGAQFDHIPNAVAPSEISLHERASHTQDDNQPTTPSASARASQNLESFARIEFEDSVFQMTTYAVIIGRDQKAINQARKDERRMEGYRRKVDEAMRNGLPPPTPIAFDRGKFSKSYVSEEGGMLGPESDGEDNVRTFKKRRMESAHASVNGDEGNDGEAADRDRVKSNRQYVSHTPGAAAVDVGTLQPSPAHIPFIGIHSPGPDIAKKTKGISRQHLKIQFNETLGVFQAVALHRNGFFVGDVICKDEHPVTLRSGEKLQIKDVAFRFIINGVEEGKTGGEELQDEETSSKRMSIGGKEMSFDFEHSENEKYQDSSEDLSPPAERIKSPPPARVPTVSPIVKKVPAPVPAPAPVAIPVPEAAPPQPVPPRAPSPVQLPMPEAPLYHGLSQEELALSQLQEAVSRASPSDPPQLPMPEPAESVEPLPPPMEDIPMEDMRMIDASSLGLGDEFPPEFLMQIPKRRGPGRPPKDGIMSKRERRLLKKQLQENSRKTLPQEPQGEKIKRPVGRPRKNPLPEDGEKIEKRKYNKRKSVEDGDLGSDAERRARDKKDKKVRPKSPPLQLNREDFTEEQLAKPSKNYGVLIDEALAHGPPEGLTLKQIYKRITQRYPWFYFHAETKGWESSVRHNLIGNEAFKKAEATGLWSRVPGVELDAGKKRKAVSPDRHMGGPHGHLAHMGQHQYYQGGPYMSQPMPYAHGLPNAFAGSNQSQRPGQPVQNAHPGVQHQAMGQPGYPTQTPAPAQLPPGYGAAGLNRPAAAGQPSTYSSPYARPPPPPPAHVQNDPVKVEPNTAASTPGMHQPSGQPGPATNNAAAQQPTPQQPPQPTQTTQQQGQPPRPAPPVASANSSVPTNRPYLTPEMEKAIAQFRTNVMADLSKHTKNAGQIIDAAIGRVRGLSTPPTVPGFEEVERTLVNGLQSMISKMQRVEMRSATPASASPAPAHLQVQKQTPSQLQPQRQAQPQAAPRPAPPTTATAASQPPQHAQAASTLVAPQQAPAPASTTQPPQKPAQPQPPQVSIQAQAQAQRPNPQTPAQPSQTQMQAHPKVTGPSQAQGPAVPQAQTQAQSQPPAQLQAPRPVAQPQAPPQGQIPVQNRPQAPPQAWPQPAAQPVPVKTTPTPTQTPTPGAAPAGTTSACDAEIQRRIKSFRESIIGTLKAKTNQAEAIVDSAIRRAQGLSNPGAFKGWEQADRLMYESVTKIINDVRKRQELAAQSAKATAGSPSGRSSQTPVPTTMSQKGPSASPVPGASTPSASAAGPANQPRASPAHGQPNASSPPSATATTPNMKPATPYVPRPGISVARPASANIHRPSPSSMANSPPARKASVSGPGLPASVAGPQLPHAPSPSPAPAIAAGPSPSPRPATVANQPAPPASRQNAPSMPAASSPAIKSTIAKHNFSGAVNPSAGVVDQIAAHKPRTSISGPATPSPAGATAATAIGKPPTGTPNFSGAAPPSAGVMSQITGHQQRTASDAAAAKFPSPAPPSAGVLDQITSQHQKMANQQQAAKPASPAPPRPTPAASAQNTVQSAGSQPVAAGATAPRPAGLPATAARPMPAPAAVSKASEPRVVASPAAAQATAPHASAAPATTKPANTIPGAALQAAKPAAVPPAPTKPAASQPAVPQNGASRLPTGTQQTGVPPSAPPATTKPVAPQPGVQQTGAAAPVATAPRVTTSPALKSAPPASAAPPAATIPAAPQPGTPQTEAPQTATTAQPPATTITTTQQTTSAATTTGHQAQDTNQLAGQKRPLDPESSAARAEEEPQPKKIAISAAE